MIIHLLDVSFILVSKYGTSHGTTHLQRLLDLLHTLELLDLLSHAFTFERHSLIEREPHFTIMPMCVPPLEV